MPTLQDFCSVPDKDFSEILALVLLVATTASKKTNEFKILKTKTDRFK